MTLFDPPKSISETKRLIACSEAEAFANLEKAARFIVKNARWMGLIPSKVIELQKPLLQLKLARRKAA